MGQVLDLLEHVEHVQYETSEKTSSVIKYTVSFQCN